MLDKPSILLIFLDSFNKFNNTGARMLESIYHMTLQLFAIASVVRKRQDFPIYTTMLWASFHLCTSTRHFSVVPYITICPSTETYLGLYLRGVMSAVTGTYLFRLLLNIIFFRSFFTLTFFTLTNSAYPDEMPHNGISPVCTCKKYVPKIYFTIEMQPNIFF